MLPAFYDYPAARWIHLRTTNRSNAPSPLSGSGSVVSKGPGSGAAGVAMAAAAESLCAAGDGSGGRLRSAACVPAAAPDCCAR
jgi:hypothetical protein